MLQRDFILRMIEEMAKLIAVALKLKSAGKTSEAYEELKTMTEKLTGIPYDVVIEGSSGGKSVAVKQTDPVEYLDAKGQFFFTAGELCLDLDKRGEAQRLFETALFFYSSAEDKHKSFSFQRQVDLTKIFEYLDRMATP